jgi:hypothetical protein
MTQPPIPAITMPTMAPAGPAGRLGPDGPLIGAADEAFARVLTDEGLHAWVS